MANSPVPPPNLRMLEGKIGANTATGQVLRQLREVTHEKPASHSEDHDEDDGHGDEVEHVDERWLVSYADMMTLLFGLFVMLYSMANKFEKVQQTVSKTFEGEPKAEPSTPKVDPVPPPPPPPAPSQEKVAALEKELNVLREARTQDEQMVRQVRKELEMRIVADKELQGKLAQAAEESERKRQENDTLKAQVVADPSKELRNRLEQKDQELKILRETQKQLPTQSKVAALAQDLTRAKAETEALKERVKVLAAKTTESSEATRQLAKLTRQLEQLKKAQADRQGFMAYVINWNTKDHDIDLVIEDPTGKRFDFKTRKYPDHPGNLALDTRRGPGTEVWQSEKILPGTYTATYTFYNQYGNTEPAVVQASIFTPLGQVTLPSVQLNFATKKTATLKFQVSDEGKVTTQKEQ